jgi:hypothetical protein
MRCWHDGFADAREAEVKRNRRRREKGKKAIFIYFPPKFVCVRPIPAMR